MKIIVGLDFDVTKDALVYGLFEDDLTIDFNTELSSELKSVLKKKIFAPTFGESYCTRISGLSFQKVFLLGLGKKKELTLERLRRALGKSVKLVKGVMLESFTTNIAAVIFHTGLFSEEILGQAVAEGLLLGNYSFTRYLSSEKLLKKKIITSVAVQWKGNSATFEKGLRRGIVIAESTNFAKDLANEPAGVVTPAYLEEVALKIADEYKLKITVLHQEELLKEGLNALQGVGVGSTISPRLIILEYNGCKDAGKNLRIALVGKGITFDSGGYNLKMTNYIETMKYDMAGAGAVLGVLKAAAQLGLEKNIIGVIPTCENLVSGSAQKPGDIVRAYNGKTIEITNTDAEGRLILADALSYTEAKYNPSIMVDVATLTGACVVALGYYAAGLMGKDRELLKGLTSAGDASGDRVWEMPFYDEYQDWMDGSISDLRNTTGRCKGYEGGSILGGVFLSKFVSKAKWAHLDIAGTGFLVEEGDYVQKGATGAGVRVLMYWLIGDEKNYPKLANKPKI